MQRGRVSGALEQLEGASAAVDGAAADLLSALGDGTGRPLEQEFGDAASSATGAIEVLQGIAGKIRAMSRAAVTLGEETLARIEPLNQVTTELSDRVDHLSHQMNLVALNAQIQAVRIDAGTGLEVLAAHTATVATEAAGLGESIREGLERFQGILQAEAHALAEGNSDGRAQEAHLASVVRAREERLRGLGEAIAQHMDRMRADLCAVRDAVQRVANTSKPGRDEQEGFAGMRDALAELAAQLPETSRQHILQHIEDDDHHAIAAERENHLKIAGALGGAASDRLDRPSDCDSQVELF
jgi:hypothetical protein